MKRILLIIVFFTLILFSSCNIVEPDVTASDWSGTWILSSSTHTEDSSFVGKAIITLRSDSTFTCSFASFWYDSLPSFTYYNQQHKNDTISGRWMPMHYTEEHNSYDKLMISIGSINRSWYLNGSKSTSLMIWSDDISLYREEYRWTLNR